MANPDARLTPVAIRQSGAFTRKQALAAGFSSRQIERRLNSGLWLRLLTSVYVVSTVPDTWTTWAWAGVLNGGPGTSIIGGSAAAAWGRLPRDWPITLAVPPTFRPVWPRHKLRAYTLTVPDGDLVSMQGLPVANRLRLAVDAAHLMPLAEAQELIDRLLVRGDVNLTEFTAAVQRSTRYGSKQARRLVATAHDRAASEAERLSHRILRAAGLTSFQANYSVTANGRTYLVDLAFVGQRVAIEIQGWAFHQSPEQRRADDAKALDLQLAGWLVIRLTWQDLVQRPDWVVASVRNALDRRR